MPSLTIPAGGLGIPLEFGSTAVTVTNNGPSTVFYRDEHPVSASVNDGSIVSAGTASLSDTQFLYVAAGSASLQYPAPSSASAVGGASRTATTVAYAATVTPTLPSSGDLVLNIGALTGNVTVANPTGAPTDGQTLRLRMAQDGTGSWTASFGTAYAFGTDVPSSTVPTAASAKFELLFSYCSADLKWRASAIIRGF